MNTTTASDIGARIAQRLVEALGARRYAMWFDKCARFDYQDQQQTLHVAVPNRFIADGIGRHFEQTLREAVEHVVDDVQADDLTVEVQIAPDRFTQHGNAQVGNAQVGNTQHGKTQDGNTAAANHGDAASAHAAPSSESRDSSDHTTSNGHHPRRTPRGRATTHVDSRLTTLYQLRHRLNDFVVGASNQLAFAAAHRLAEDEAEAGAPLFLHGGCGLGKTHLLQGVCRQFLEHHPHANVLYTTGEQFTNEYITAVRTNKLDRFRRWIRQLDLLAVDDVDFIANKQATQQEFLHSFDQIELSGARVVLASDSHPKLIEQFSEALVSRCVRGLVVPIKPLDAKTRARLVQVFAERRSLMLAPEAARTLGAQCQGSVREIEGALTKLQALVALARQNGQSVSEPIGHALVQQLLDADAANEPRKPVRFDTVLSTVVETLGVSEEQVRGRGRHRLIVLARSLAIYLARQLTSMSYPEIARALDRGNHSTVITAAQRVQKQLDLHKPVALPAHLDGETLRELIDRLSRQIVRG